jgi:hypothetical protein
LCDDPLVHRRGARIVSVAALVLTLLGALLNVSVALADPRATAADGPLMAIVSDNQTGQVMAPGFVGISFEYRALHLYTGRDPRAVDPVLLQLLRQLAPGQAPVLRIGGDSTDATWWPMRGVIPPGGVTYSLTQGWLRTTQALATDLGAHLILGVNLAAGRPALAAAEARALLAGIGRQYISALEIGNEPNLYGASVWYRDRKGHVFHARDRRYDLSTFITDFSRFAQALPRVPLAGPALSAPGWMGGLGRFISSEKGVKIVTYHRYPLRACVTDPTSPDYASIANLLSDSSSAGLAAPIAAYAAVAHAHGLQFRIGELNSASCQGLAGTSDTFASALWVLDTLFNMASVGVDGVNIHTLPGAPYQPFELSQSPTGTWQATVDPEYYGLLMFARAFPPGARLLAVNAPSGPVKVWATQASDGTIRVVLINKDTTAAHSVALELPGGLSGASLESLQAPAVAATTGITLGGQSFADPTTTGTFPGLESTPNVYPTLGSYSIDLAPASAAMLTRSP